MNNIDLSYLDECALEISEDEIYTTALKIFDIILSLDEIKNQSRIFEYDFSNLNFELSFCTDETIKEINRNYRQKDRATDVITFALFADDDNSLVINGTIELGEIIISVDTAKNQAQENKTDIKTELATLIAHGVLHLLGFDHLEQKDYDFVVGIQNKVINSL